MDRLRDDEPEVPADFTLARDPWPLFAAWMDEAAAAEPEDANAMALATADADGLPDVRSLDPASRLGLADDFSVFSAGGRTKDDGQG